VGRSATEDKSQEDLYLLTKILSHTDTPLRDF